MSARPTRLTKMLDRVGNAMTMTAGSETSEIIRRRLFDWDPRALGADGKVILPEKAKDGCAGSGQIIGTDIFGPYDRPLEAHETERLLEVSLPAASGDKMPIGRLLNGALLSLLEVRHPGWADEEGCEGRVEIFWVPRPDGTTETQVPVFSDSSSPGW